MSDERIKDLPATVPERARMPRDATIALPAPVFGPSSSSTSLDSVAPLPLDSYQPPHTGTAALSTPPSQREQIVPSAATVGSVLEHIRKPTVERLEVEARLASGGMGSIDVVIDHALDRRIAIKTLHPHLRSDDQTVRMFLREARLTGLLDHPHIVPVYDLGERESGELYFAMKLVEGQTLAALIRGLPRGVLDTATLYTLLDVFAKVCDALAFAHSRGVLHCDVKPANVMVGEFGQVFLMDWGIARLVVAEGAPTSLTRAGGAAPPRGARTAQTTDNSIIGTPGYMSPEQARGDRKKLDVRSDVFLLGALLYEILTHRPPYLSSDKSETLALAAAGTFPNPRKVAGEVAVPLELERIVLRAMARTPEERYPSVAALREDVVRFMRGGAEFPRRTFQAGAAIVREGEPGDAAYIIVEGRCDIRKETPSGTQTLHTIEPGAVFGEMAILTQGPRTATVVAVEPTTVLVVTSHDLEHEMATLKPWMATLLKSLASRFRDADTHSRATHPATLSPARVANQVLMNLETWGERDGRGGRWMKWTELAAELEAQLGLPPVALFGAIARYGLALDVEGDRLTIADPAALRARLGRELAPAQGG
ncbi:MAG: cyclic nucleotide-binding domain-containing protein [Labilithrix sp.]|nr:cyclic nucleotide-binding domain-containing protein [Labilithrix sp.]